METIDDPALQAYFVRTRGALGHPHRRAARGAPRDQAALARGEPVGLVGDRDLTGGGIARCGCSVRRRRCPLGPALLAIESGARPTFGVSAGSAARSLHGRLDPVPVPAEGSRRERVTA